MSKFFLFFHTEKLHDDAVWSALQPFLDLFEHQKLSPTFFVYPFRSLAVGKDPSVRIRELLSRGFEVGQHTHFYRGEDVESVSKQDDFTEENIERCLRRDFDFLRSCGAAPLGFTSGGWHKPPTLYQKLSSLGFCYDASSVGPEELFFNEKTHEQTVSRLVTTSSIGRWFLGGSSTTAQYSRGVESCTYRSAYLHDYDLVYVRYRVALRAAIWATGHINAPQEMLSGR